MQDPLLKYGIFTPDIIKRADKLLKAETAKQTNMNQDTDSFVKELIRNNITVFKRLADR